MDEEVRVLQNAMDDAGGMRGGDARAGLHHDARGEPPRKRIFRWDSVLMVSASRAKCSASSLPVRSSSKPSTRSRR